ncbi:hypothetical protein K469DRAFT_673964 [Zopfia rhizophila CBS 207.26]|uniref:Zn(2)-C6 fungal-type domain-containing protein n=1 Tax=Zopfia rhizophila CBS 207.26 TaxID=1314779 RepID=A0A6A6DMD6_9PEZI|nr:hypothetical protein K469DRAFT_673964 [Zopfia rhizophila CBS 207.26]
MSTLTVPKVPKNMPTTDPPTGKKRRHHHKSRKGCKECKQRHVKCDEQHPTCANCSTTNRHCSYLDHRNSDRNTALLQHVSRSQSQTPTLSNASKTSSPDGGHIWHHTAAIGTAPADEQVPQVFDLSHLALLYHLQTVMMKPPHTPLVADEKDSGLLLEMIFKSALSAPYLMDELLAFSALHLSTLKSDVAEKHRYYYQAVQLMETRALMLFNAALPEIREENCVAIFLFSSFLGMHILFDTVAFQKDLVEFLDKFIQFLGLYRGVRTVTGRGWHIICGTEMKLIIDSIEAVDQLDPQPTDVGNECDRLMSLLITSSDSLGSAPFKACREAIQSLGWVLSQHRALPHPTNLHIVLAWPVRITTEYIDMVKQRRPEALVILAHWAVLLHYGRNFWVFGDAGQFLIESIARYLGVSWDEWMAWPKEVLDAV